MKLLPIGIIIGVLFLAMAGVLYFVVIQMKPMEVELEVIKQTLTSRISDIRETEDQLADSLEKGMNLQNELDAAEAKITDLEFQIKRLQKAQ